MNCPLCDSPLKFLLGSLTCFSCDLDFDQGGGIINHDDFLEDYCLECGARLSAKEALNTGSRHYGYCIFCTDQME